jgi:hypothetical protein
MGGACATGDGGPEVDGAIDVGVFSAIGGRSGIGGKSAVAVLDDCGAYAGGASVGRVVGDIAGGVAAMSPLELAAGSPQAGAGGNFVGPESLANGGIPIAGAASNELSISGGNGAGPSLILVNKNTPTATRIVIVIKGRIELIVRPP